MKLSDNEIIVKIVKIIIQPGELITDGECLEEVWGLLKVNGYDPDIYRENGWSDISLCPMCEFDNLPLGILGSRLHYSCRVCGNEWSETKQAKEIK